MKTITTEFSFVIKPSQFGVGVFAAHDILAGSYLRLFHDEGAQSQTVLRQKSEVPEYFRQFCVSRGDILRCPRDFGAMEVGWHLNHSKKPNAYQEKRMYYALRDIKMGEEITIDYNSLGEPEEAKEAYYKE